MTMTPKPPLRQPESYSSPTKAANNTMDTDDWHDTPAAPQGSTADPLVDTEYARLEQRYTDVRPPLLPISSSSFPLPPPPGVRR